MHMENTAIDIHDREYIRTRIKHFLTLYGIPRSYEPPAHIETIALPLDVPAEEATHYAVWANEKPFGVYSVEKQRFTYLVD